MTLFNARSLTWLLPLLLALALLPVAGCGRADSEDDASDPDTVVPLDAPDDGKPVLVVTTSYLGSAAADLLGEGWHIVSLQPPGTCPGHFDTTPQMVEVIGRSSMLFRFDFQSGLDVKLDDFEDLEIVAVTAPEGLSTPASYRQVLREMYPQLMGVVDSSAMGVLNTRLSGAVGRMDALETELKKSAADAGLKDLPVVASGHMAVFCETLGLKVLARYGSPGGGSPRDLQRLVEAGRGAKLIVATEQEGLQQARYLAERLDGAPVVSLSNFPATCGEGAFDAMARKNLQTLLDGLTR